MRAGVGRAGEKGRGVFAKERIARGEVIESSPVIIFPKSQWENIKKTTLGVYCYFWGEEFEDGAVVLGLGSLYNHSFRPNANYVHHLDAETMDFVAIKDIHEGEEITINYNGSPDDKSPVWFDVLP